MGAFQSAAANDGDRSTRSLPMAKIYVISEDMSESELINLIASIIVGSCCGILMESMSNISVLASKGLVSDDDPNWMGVYKVNPEYYSTDSFFEVFGSAAKIVFAAVGI